MKRHAPRPMGEDRILTAVEDQCPDCDRVLPVCQSFARLVEGLDYCFRLVRRDKRCGRACPGLRPIFHAPMDPRIVLPQRIYGLDVTLHVGERHLGDGVALGQITRNLNARGLPVDQRHTCRIFRDFLALTVLARGTEAEVQERLRRQGGIVLMVDGVQFDNRAPVLYMAWDALSGMPLFGERKPFRSEGDLKPILERVRAMQVPVVGIVTDKEKGLVPAVSAVFPDVPYQFCHTHFLKNCAKPLQSDLTQLGASVARRAERVRDIEKDLSMPIAPASPPPDSLVSATPPAIEASPAMTDASVALPAVEASPAMTDASVAPPAVEASPAMTDASVVPMAAPTLPSVSSGQPTEDTPLTEEGLVRELCDMVRANSRVSGKAPLDPPELARHERLNEVGALVHDALKKKTRRARAPKTGPCSVDSVERWR